MRPVRPPHPNPRPPRFKLPAGACDTHLHVYGPFDRYPLIAERNHDPDPRSTLDGATLRLAGVNINLMIRLNWGRLIDSNGLGDRNLFNALVVSWKVWDFTHRLRDSRARKL